MKTIYTACELQNMDPTGRYRLGADIDLQNIEWTPLGRPDCPFSGTLDGVGHRLTGLKLSKADAWGNCGLFGVFDGEAYDLFVEGTIDLQGDRVCAGLLAGENRGSFYGVEVHGAVKINCCGNEQIKIGGLAGENWGQLQNIQADVSMMVAGGNTAVAIGGIAGISRQGVLECVELLGALDWSGANLRGGLFIGEAWMTRVIACRYSGPMNLKNKNLFHDFCGRETDCQFEGCLWRDNTNSDLWLSQQARHLRDACCEHMKTMGSISWAPDRTLTYRCSCGAKVHGQIFEKDRTCIGMPYTHKHHSYEEFLSCFRPDGRLQPWIPSEGFDGMDLYMGNDCSGAVYWAWSRVCNDLKYRWTSDMMPIHDNGVVPVGEYQAFCSEDSDQVIAESGENAIYEAYAQTHIADAILHFRPGKGGHVRLLTQNAVVYRDRLGKIFPKASYMTTHEQGDGLYPEHPEHSSWLLDHRYYFHQLRAGGYIPVSNTTLLTGRQVQSEVVCSNGIISSNYRITGVTVQVTEEQGEPVWEKQYFTAHSTYAQEGNDGRPRQPVYQFDLTSMGVFFKPHRMEAGKAYVCHVTVLLSTGEQKQMEPIPFEWNR